MSSVSRPTTSHINGMSIDNGEYVLHYENAESLYNTNATLTGAGTAGTHDTCFPQLRFNSLTLDELSKELHKRTEETQKLQEEVERATKMALERVGCTYSTNSTPLQSYQNPKWSSCQDSTIQAAHQEAMIQPLVCGLDGLNQEVQIQRDGCPGKEVLDNVVDNNSRQASDLQKQLNKSRDQHLEQAIMKLQTKLHEVQLERDVLSDLRMKDSKKHADQMEKMLCMLEELQIMKRSGDQKLQETEDEALSLSRKVETLEWTIKEVYCTLLSHEKQCGHNSLTSPNIATSPRQLCQGDLAAKVLEDLNNETLEIHESLFLPVEHMGEEEYLGLTKQKERLEQLIASLGQEVATLTDKLSSWKRNNAVLCVKLELLKKHAEKQTSFRQRQVSELKSALSHYKDKVCCLEQQLTEAQSEVEEAQRGRDRSSQQTAVLQFQLGQLKLEVCQAHENLAHEKEQRKDLQEKAMALSIRVEELHEELEERSLLVKQLKTLVGAVKEDCQAQMETLRCGEQQQCGLQAEIRALRGQLGVAREQLNRAGEEKTCLQALLEQRDQEGRKTQQVLEEKEEQLKYRQQETQRGLARLEEVQSRCQILHAEGETLRLKLDDREKTVDILRLQMENSTQMAVQHGCTIDRLNKENNHLSNQLNQHKLEIQQLRAQLDLQKSGLAAMEHRRHRHQASVTEQRHRVHEETLEKQQLTTQLEVQRMQLLALTKEHKELQRLHSCKNEEHQGVALKLQSQLRNAYTELDQARSTLSTLEGADGHGFQVATGMQKQITAKREQIDSLKGRIQQLEETVEKMSQEKHYQELENQRRVQELAFIKEEKKRLTMELESLHAKEKQFRERISELEAALQKMSESFAGCNDFIQLQKQEFCRLKLQHALDLKELQGQNERTAVNATPSAPVSSAHSVTPSSTLASDTPIKKTPRQQDSPTRELRSLVKELRGVISESHRPHTGNSTSISSSHRRRSAPERVQRTTLCSSTDAAKEVIVCSKLGTKNYSSEPQLLKTPELNGKKIFTHFHEGHCVFSPVTAARYASSPKLVSPGRKSPVHFLLTSDPNSSP